ncbi:hypothetical protein [Stenotrophomonas phage c9-N]|uniref:Uncharacterized protein n=1 Tax=Stenotrophomonas phage vB_SmeS_BUCT700 TaxID=2924895 RepID=A0AAE9GB29_9CAUD|nr:hypothetical protein [Stenotrophomonas phage vB_SmeS_BUCT700]UNY50282.1 hypothetical protein [Stenotrophomonas phage vB_SmeS_BUCT703]WKC56417.1 hypothetical protein [Stenotrophomonas phage c9-N]
MQIHLSDRMVSWHDDHLTRDRIEVYRVTAQTEDGDFHHEFKVRHNAMRARDPKQLHYHLNRARNEVTRAAIQKHYAR